MATIKRELLHFWQELKRRRVIRAAIVYLGTAVIIMQSCDMFFPRLGLPQWTVSVLIGMLAAGFPMALFLSWYYEITPDGLDRSELDDQPQSTAQKPLTSDVIIGILACIIVVLAILPRV